MRRILPEAYPDDGSPEREVGSSISTSIFVLN